MTGRQGESAVRSWDAAAIRRVVGATARELPARPGIPDLPVADRVEAARLHAALIALSKLSDRRAWTSTTGADTIRLTMRAPLGAVLLACAPGCSATTIVTNVVAALLAGNRVAVSLIGDEGDAARRVIGRLRDAAPGEELTTFPSNSWNPPWEDVSIAVVIPARVFMNDESGPELHNDPDAPLSLEAMIAFYSAEAELCIGYDATPYRRWPLT